MEIECPKCGRSRIELPLTRGSNKQLVERVEFLEQRLFDLVEENKDLRLLIQRL